MTEATPVTVTLTTPFRSIPALPLDRWVSEFQARQSPLTLPEIGDCYAACGGWAVLLDQAIGESSLTDSDAVRDKNLLRLTGPHGAFLRYSAFWKAFAEGRARLLDPHYKSGVYYPRQAAPLTYSDGGQADGWALSLAGYKVIYQGGRGCLDSRGQTCANGETYGPNAPMLGASVVADPRAPSINRSIAASMLRYERWFGAPTPPPPGPTPGVVFGRVPAPAGYVERIIAPGVNVAWDNLGPRKPRGLVLHRMLGTLLGTDAFFRGEARARALTDFGVGNGGQVFRWTLPGAAIAPYASGPANGIDGHGAPFWRWYQADPIGTSIFNRDCEAIEIEGRQYSDPVPAADYTALVELVAWRADAWLRIPWDQWPLNNDGVHCLLGHAEITDDKPCPGSVVYSLVPQLIEDVRARLKAHQAELT